MEIDVTSPSVAPAVVVSQPGPVSTVVVETKVSSINVKGYVSAKADAHYTHIQSTPEAVWTVTHNLGKKPSVVVVDSADTVVMGEIEYLTTNSVRLTFVGAFSGKAYFN
jgi:hypothetical protein